MMVNPKSLGSIGPGAIATISARSTRSTRASDAKSSTNLPVSSVSAATSTSGSTCASKYRSKAELARRDPATRASTDPTITATSTASTASDTQRPGCPPGPTATPPAFPCSSVYSRSAAHTILAAVMRLEDQFVRPSPPSPGRVSRIGRTVGRRSATVSRHSPDSAERGRYAHRQSVTEHGQPVEDATQPPAVVLAPARKATLHGGWASVVPTTATSCAAPRWPCRRPRRDLLCKTARQGALRPSLTTLIVLMCANHERSRQQADGHPERVGCDHDSVAPGVHAEQHDNTRPPRCDRHGCHNRIIDPFDGDGRGLRRRATRDATWDLVHLAPTVAFHFWPDPLDIER